MNDPALRVGFAVWPDDTLSALVARNEVVVCSASLMADADSLARALTLLDSTERERFERYENKDVARRFAMARFRLREMLAALLAIPARAVPIQIGLHGKPALARGLQPSGIRFSIAHCEELMLVALSRVGEVGIDAEPVRPIERWRVWPIASSARRSGRRSVARSRTATSPPRCSCASGVAAKPSSRRSGVASPD